MVARLIVEDCPDIEKINLGSNLKEIRANLAAIDFNEPCIHILKLQPGVGKTYTIKKFLKKEKSFLIATGSHKLLHGEYDKIGAKHWYGIINKNCSKIKEIKKYLDYNLPIKRICKLKGCDRGKCDYWKQFNTQKAIAPVQYLSTNRVDYSVRKRGFKFDLLVFDEALKDYNLIKFYPEQMETSIRTILKYQPAFDKHGRVYDPINILMNNINDYIGTQEIPSLDSAHYINRLKNLALNNAIGKGEWDDASTIAKFDIHGYRKFIYYYNVYEDIDSYPEPYMYYALDLALQGVPVIFLDATFDEKAFKVLLGRYIYENSVINRSILVDRELGSVNDLKIKIYYSNIADKDTTIHRMDKDNYYYRSGFLRKVGDNEALTGYGIEIIKQIREYIIRSKRKFYSIGIITYMPLVKEFHDLGPTEYFGNLRGSNTIKDVDALFIIGTPELSPNDILNDFNNLVLTDYKPENVVKFTYSTKEGEHYITGKMIDKLEELTKKPVSFGPFSEKKPIPILYKHDDPLSHLPGVYEKMKKEGVVDADLYYELPLYGLNIAESEKYQAVHRARPFENNVDIYIFGDVPDEAKKEFNLRILNKNTTENYFRTNQIFRGVYPKVLLKKIIHLHQEGKNSSEIAAELKLYKHDKSKGYNTTFVTQILSGDVSPRDISKIDNIIRNTPLVTYHRLPGRIDEKFRKYCIYYAKQGDFIKS